MLYDNEISITDDNTRTHIDSIFDSIYIQNKVSCIQLNSKGRLYAKKYFPHESNIFSLSNEQFSGQVIRGYTRKCLKYINKFDSISIVSTKIERPVAILPNSKIINYEMSLNELKGSFILRNPISSCIRYIDISLNKLTYLCIDRVNTLIELNASSNNLLHVSIKNNESLTRINLRNNLIKSVDLSKNSKLVYIDLSFNSLEYINSKMISDSVLCFLATNNKLEVCDMSGHTNLYTLNVCNNQIFVFDISNTNLINVYATNNMIIGLNPQALFVSIKSLNQLFLDENPFIEYEVCVDRECDVCLERPELFRTFKYCLHSFCYSCSCKVFSCPVCRAPIFESSNFHRI